MDHIILDTFKLNDIEKNTTIALINEPSKTRYLPADIIRHLKTDFQIAIVHHNLYEYYQQFIPDPFIHYKFDSEILKRMFLMQKRNRINNIRSYGCCVLDGCLTEDIINNDCNLKQIFHLSRIYSIASILSMKSNWVIYPSLRTCIDYCFIFREDIPEHIENMYKCYAGIFPTYDIFKTTLDRYTQNGGCIVIKNNVISNKIEDVVFCYK